MADILPQLLNLTLVIFMFGSLLEMGLKLKLSEAKGAIRNVRFLVLTLLWSFVLGPALAVLLTKIIPLAEPYALGMLFLGMAPCAPFLPKLAERAGGDLPYVAAFMALTAVGTIVYMPFAVPVLVQGFAAEPWTIAKPLLLFIGLPLSIGVAIRSAAEAFAERWRPIVKKVTDIDTLILGVVILWMYGKDYLSAVGSYAIGTQLLYYGVLAAASYGLSFGLPHGQKSVLALGLCTRNIGAAVAPMLAVSGTDQRAIVMCTLSTFICFIGGFGVAAVLARFGTPGEPAAATTAGRS
jgi:bile acid:Na+ symporter, BASS family